MARLVTIPIGPIFSGGPCRGIIHVIEKGDTLYKLGQRYHVSVSRIMYANPYVNIYNLQVGDELCIPVGPQPREDMDDLRNLDALGGRENQDALSGSREDMDDRYEREDMDIPDDMYEMDDRDRTI